MTEKSTNNRVVFLEETFGSVFNGIEFEINECSAENRFRTFVLPNGDRIVICFAHTYNMNRYDVPYWLKDKNDSVGKNDSTQQNKTRRRKTRVFVHRGYSGMNEIEEYMEDHVWLINQTNMELWNHQIHQLVKTIDVVDDATNEEPFIYFMKNGNIAVFTTKKLRVYDPDQPQNKAHVLKISINQPHEFIIQLVVETTGDQLYFLYYCNDEFKHNLIFMDKNGGGYSGCIFRIPIETNPTGRFVSKENRDSGSLEERVSRCLINKRDQRLLTMFRCFVRYNEQHSYGIYEWNSGRSFHPNILSKYYSVSDFGIGFEDADLFVILARCDSRLKATTTNRLSLISINDFDAQVLNRVNLGKDYFRTLVVDANTIVCIPIPRFKKKVYTRVFKIRSR